MKKLLALFACIGLTLSTLSAQTNVTNSVREFRQTNEHRLFNEFIEMLKMPNVASDTPNIRKNANYLLAEMQKRGLKPRLLEAADKKVPPAVYGEWMTPGVTKTVIFYAHYDGQPTDAAAWTGSKPWEPVLRSNALEKAARICRCRRSVRRSTRNRGSTPARLRMTRPVCSRSSQRSDALRAQKIKPTLNIKFIFEGQEEDGSPNLRRDPREEQRSFESRCIHRMRRTGPSVGAKASGVRSFRGVTSVDITVYGANRPLHSGHYGNWSPNPANTLVRLIASMKDERGNIVVKGWADDVEPLGPAELQAIKDAPAL
jgi:acetylornithine deacetylase/succinyl-diaminopimelate desuccinylase-like protein